MRRVFSRMNTSSSTSTIRLQINATYVALTRVRGTVRSTAGRAAATGCAAELATSGAAAGIASSGGLPVGSGNDTAMGYPPIRSPKRPCVSAAGRRVVADVTKPRALSCPLFAAVLSVPLSRLFFIPTADESPFTPAQRRAAATARITVAAHWRRPVASIRTSYGYRWRRSRGLRLEPLAHRPSSRAPSRVAQTRRPSPGAPKTWRTYG